MILFPETARMLRTSEMFSELERTLRGLGLDMEVVVVPEKGALTGLSIEQIERKARQGPILCLQLNRQGGDSITNPDRNLTVQGGDGVVIVSRSGGAARGHVRGAGGKNAGGPRHILMTNKKARRETPGFLHVRRWSTYLPR